MPKTTYVTKDKEEMSVESQWKWTQINFGKNVFRLRKKAKLSQESLAKSSGVHVTYISSVERGERNISLINIHRIAKALKCAPSSLLREK